MRWSATLEIGTIDDKEVAGRLGLAAYAWLECYNRII
jgi:hypothetical protein